MTGYILKLIQGVLDFQDKADPCYFYYVEEILKELERLDPRDFIPEMRPRLIQSKVHLKGLLRREATNKTVDGELLDLYQILETYKGEGSRGEEHLFPFVSNADLRQEFLRDYRELSYILLPSQAWKSSVLLAGSLCESILYDILTAHPAILEATSHHPEAPAGRSLCEGEWRLEDFLRVATSFDILSQEKAEALRAIFHQYRERVHPLPRFRLKHKGCTEAEAYLAKGALETLCNALEERFQKK